MKPGGVPGGVFKTADGWMSIIAINDRDFHSLCAAMDLSEVAGDARFIDSPARFRHEAELYAILRPAIEARTSAVWSERLTNAKLMHERLNSYAEFLEQPQVRETKLIQWLAQAGVPQPVPVPFLPGTGRLADGAARAVAPVCGQHTEAILGEHGFSHREIADLAASGAIALGG